MFRKAKKYLAIVLAVVSFAVILTAAIALAEQVTIKLGQTPNWVEMMPRKEAVDEFTKETGIGVEWLEYPLADLKQKYMLDVTVGKGEHDILTLFDGIYGLFYDYVLPLNDYIERDFKMSPEKFVQRYFGPLQDKMYKDGKVMFLPVFANVQWGVYRKDLFENSKEKAAFRAKYGYELRPPATFQQLVDVARFFTRDNNKDGKIDLWGLLIPGKGDTGATVFEDLIYRYGLEYLDKDMRVMWGKPGNREKAIEVAQFLYDLVHKYKVAPPGTTTYEFKEVTDLYLAGKGAMAFSWLAVYWFEMNSPDTIKRIGKTGVWSWPSKVPGRGGFSGFWAHAISKRSKNPDAAWEFLKWAHSDRFFKVQVQKSPWTPPLKHIGDWTIKEGFLEPDMVRSAEGARVFPPIPEMQQIRDVVSKNYGAMLTGQLTPKAFVDQSVQEMESILAKAGYYKQ